MINNKRVKKILSIIDDNYSKDVKCYLNYETSWQLLVATILSAQCTDNRVNIVTGDLFKKYKCIEDFIAIDQEELENDIRPTGFYRNKAKNIKRCCSQLKLKYDGEIPKEIDKLTELSGVGRKTANVIRGNIYNIPSVVVDTHVKRVSNKLGFTTSQDPVKIEFDLMDIIPKEHWIRYNTQIMAHGRSICTARKPKCEICFLLPYCPYGLSDRLQKVKQEDE